MRGEELLLSGTELSRAAGTWASPLPAVPLSFLSYPCVCACTRLRVCVYIIIYMCLLVCWKIVEVGGELAPEPDLPVVFHCPTAELRCRQFDGGKETRGMGAGSAQGEGLQPQRLCFQSLLLLPNKKLLFGNLLLL